MGFLPHKFHWTLLQNIMLKKWKPDVNVKISFNHEKKLYEELKKYIIKNE